MASNEQMFLFDTTPFEAGIKRVASAMLILPQTASKVAGGISKAFKSSVEKIGGVFKGSKKVKEGFSDVKKTSNDMTNSVTKGMTKMALKAGLVALAFKAVQGILNNMPEIGKAFGLAKDVFMKNLLWPLRKMIFPYLQRFMDWVRDNRLRFVKWGQLVANVFSVIARQVKFVIGIGKKLITAFKGFFEKTFGVTITNMEEMFNILSFKFAVVMAFLQQTISKLVDRFTPALEALGEIFSELITWVSEFVSGFMESLAEIDKEFGIIDQLNSTFSELIVLLKTIPGLLKPFTSALKPLGKIIGTVFGVHLLASLRAIESTLVAMSGLVGLLTGQMSGEEFMQNIKTKGLGKFFGGKNESIEDGIISSDGRIIRTSPANTIVTRKVKDAIIKDDGTVIETDPKDNLIATKNKIMLNPGTTENSGGKVISLGGIKIDFSGMQIILQNGTKEEAVNVGEMLVETVRSRLQLELEAIGEY